MAHEGALVIVLDILSEEASRVADELNSLGAKARAMTADVSKRNEVDQMVEQTLRQFGKVDILVNNAGIVRPAPLEDVKEEDWDRVVSVNLKGTFFCTQAVLPTMKKNKYGKIVNIGSRASLGKSDRTVYAATKAGLIGVTRTWALELAPHNINVNYVGPGPIATELFKSVNPEGSEKTKAIISAIPLQRMGQPQDVANLISFLASDEASFITGQAIFICGGITVGLAHY
jgi:NAD(P)-dependent dehydrogenase (short-subunit alcohol dehydrogenase family)